MKIKLNEKKQPPIKTLSNLIRLISKIGGIVLKVAIPFVIFVMILLPYIMNNIEVSNNEINFKTDKIKIVDENKISIHNIIVGEFDIDISESETLEIFNENSKFEIIGYVEAYLLLLIINIIIMIIILNYVEKLFNNINKNNTPFTLDNVIFIKKIVYFMLALMLISAISNVLFNYLFSFSKTDSPLELMNILEILIVFSMSYIFEYGYEMEKTKEKDFKN